MKWNWGTGITITLALFMGFIVYLAYRASQSHSDLYAADYYKQELAYQDKIDGLQRGKVYYNDIRLKVTPKKVLIELPKSFNARELKVDFYRPNNAALDKEFTFQILEGNVEVSREALLPGKYTVLLQWKEKGDLHLVEKQIELD